MRKIMTKEEWRRRKRKKRMGQRFMAFLLFIVIIILIALCIKKIQDTYDRSYDGIETLTEPLSNGVEIQRDYLSPNENSRPQTALSKVKGIVIHYTANPGTTAKNNRNYFQGLGISKSTYASSHFVIGLDGEIIQCIPLTEIAYASNNRNNDTISIECCHPDETGKFSEKTYDSLVSLAAALCVQYNIKEKDVLRHYDVTEKLCPLYYVNNPDAWTQMKADIMAEAKLIRQKKESENVN